MCFAFTVYTYITNGVYLPPTKNPTMSSTYISNLTTVDYSIAPELCDPLNRIIIWMELVCINNSEWIEKTREGISHCLVVNKILSSEHVISFLPFCHSLGIIHVISACLSFIIHLEIWILKPADCTIWMWLATQEYV